MTRARDGVFRTSVAAFTRRRRPFILLLAWSVPEALPALVVGYATARAVDAGFLAGSTEIGFAWLALLAAAVLVGAIATRGVHRMLGAVVEPYRDDLITLVVRSLLTEATGSRTDTGAVARLTQQVEIVRDTFAGLVTVVRGFVFTTVGALVGLTALDPLLALLVLGPLVVGLLIFALALPGMVRAQRRHLDAGERLSDAAVTTVHGLRDITVCGAETQAADEIQHHIDAQADAESTLARMAMVRTLCLAVAGWGPLAVILTLLPWLSDEGRTAGTIIGALTYVAHGLQPALHALVRGIAGGGLRYVVTLDRLLRAADDGPAAPPVPTTRPPGTGIAVRDLSFRYGPHAQPVIEHLGLCVPDGGHLAIVGPSGIGKSTLMGLLAGLLDPGEGAVRVGGVAASEIDPGVRALVPQEAYVFTGSLWDNLTYLRPDAPPEIVDRAVRTFAAETLVERVGGLDSPLMPGILSAGDRQLIALIRVELSTASLILLDEATSHLDPHAEARAERAFARRHGTLVVVAHRISSALRADTILVLDGTRAEHGSHDELLERSALYRELHGHWSPTPREPAPAEP